LIKQSDPTPLNIAVRVYPDAKKHDKQKPKKPASRKRPTGFLVFDTETRTDQIQSLIFGSYRYFDGKYCVEEGLFFGDDITGIELSTLKEYVAKNTQDTGARQSRKLLLLTRSQFIRKLYQVGYKTRGLIVGFNLPFDLSRIASDATTARGAFEGGFSLGLDTYQDKTNANKRNPFLPRLGIKHINSKSALKGFTARKNPDFVDLIPEGSTTGKPEKGYIFRGHFLDLKTLAFALTDKNYSLERACKDFGVKAGKSKALGHGVVSDEYIEYNRQDVRATAGLLFKLLEEYDWHSIDLQETKAYSPASIGKAHLKAMNIPPILKRQPEFPKQFIGYAQSAFFGGRTSVHIRKVSVPVVYVDFLSMYPTVNSLMGLWRFVIAKKIEVVENCAAEISDWLSAITPEKLFQPEIWKFLTAFVKIVPDGDIVPTRAKYSDVSKDWQVGSNYLYGDKENPDRHAIWLSLPDVVASVILTGRIPTILDAFRIVPKGTLPGLIPIRLRGELEINPAKQDFFKVAIEQRKQIPSENPLNKFLKVLANATSYGIYAEMNRDEQEKEKSTICHGIDPEPFSSQNARVEKPGEYFFSPMASLITGAARLMLALLEHSVTSLSGTYAMEDTDSMAIVATEHGGIVPCPGGSLATEDGKPAIQALSWEQVWQIAETFRAPNTYDATLVSGSVLKIEDVNFDPVSKKQRQIYCFGISAKRYALFLKDETGDPVLLRRNANSKDNGWKEHGLGHLLNPMNLGDEDRDWIGQVWLNIIREHFGLPTLALSFGHMPAVGRVTVSSPAVMKPFSTFNAGKQYGAQIKPFNFLLTAQVDSFGHPTEADPNHFHLIAPYETDPNKWHKAKWIDQYSGNTYRIITEGQHGTRTMARVKTYNDILTEYEYHPESKCADTQGIVCDKQTVGLLQRRHIQIDRIIYIGKESNRLEDVESGMVRDEGDVYTEYVDQRRDEWTMQILPALKKIALSELVRVSGLSRRALIDLRAGRSRPHATNENLLKRLLLPQSSSDGFTGEESNTWRN
jgi:hypothetical protein